MSKKRSGSRLAKKFYRARNRDASQRELARWRNQGRRENKRRLEAKQLDGVETRDAAFGFRGSCSASVVSGLAAGLGAEASAAQKNRPHAEGLLAGWSHDLDSESEP